MAQIKQATGNITDSFFPPSWHVSIRFVDQMSHHVPKVLYSIEISWHLSGPLLKFNLQDKLT